MGVPKTRREAGFRVCGGWCWQVGGKRGVGGLIASDRRILRDDLRFDPFGFALQQRKIGVLPSLPSHDANY
jgi:hypothetical protein